MGWFVVLFWIVAIAGACAARFAGSWVGRRTGARHAVAWFGALVGFVLCLVLMDGARRPGWIVRNLRDGLLSAGLVYGAVVAVFVEITMTVAESILKSRKAGGARDPRDSPPRMQFSLRSLLVVTVLIGTYLAACRLAMMPYSRVRQANARIEASLDELRQRCPEGVTKKQWDYVLDWTYTAVANCLSSPSAVLDQDRHARLADELEQRLQGKVDMSTIDWIWDEFEHISRYGKSYSEHYRPTTLENLRQAW